MTANQTIDDVPRELIEKAMLACFEAGFGIPHAELRALLDSEPCAKSQAEPDPMLCNFYEVTDWPGLVRELVGHVAQLQDSAKRNVKPWEDTFPPTLLPAYIERVNSENAASQPQGEPVACGHEWTDDGEFLLVCTACGAQEDYTQALQLAFELGGTDDGSYHLEADELCEVIRLYAEQPAPVAVVLPPEDNGNYDYGGYNEGHKHGWNDCLDEVTRLNTK